MSIRIRTKTANGETEILVRVDHPEENGRRIDPKTKAKIPPHFIQKVTFSLNGNEVAVADLGIAISRDPLIKIKVNRAGPGDRVGVSWSDNKGAADDKEITIG